MKRIGILIVALTLVAAGSALPCNTAKHVKAIKTVQELAPITSDCAIAIAIPETVVSVEMLSETIEGIGEFIHAEEFVVVSEVPMLEASVEVTDDCERGVGVLFTVMKALAKAALKGFADIVQAVV